MHVPARTFVLGDSHGGYQALLQVIERSGITLSDRLICLGDVADGWTETPELIEELMKFPYLVMIRGNHDQWLKEWLKDETKMPDIWTYQGGKNTLKAYERRTDLKKKHLDFLKKSHFYFIDEKKRLFVHGGYESGIPMEKQDKLVLMWDREIFNDRYNLDRQKQQEKDFSEIFVGHTTVFRISEKPLNIGNVWFMDTGGGHEGKLSLMNVETKEVYQSDMVQNLYRGIKAR